MKDWKVQEKNGFDSLNEKDLMQKSCRELNDQK